MDEYILRITRNKEETRFEATNDGFTAFELLGFIETKKYDIIQQIKREVKPKYKRIIKEKINE